MLPKSAPNLIIGLALMGQVTHTQPVSLPESFCEYGYVYVITHFAVQLVWDSKSSSSSSYHYRDEGRGDQHQQHRSQDIIKTGSTEVLHYTTLGIECFFAAVAALVTLYLLYYTAVQSAECKNYEHTIN